MKVKALLAIAAALALSACVVADDPYYDDYPRENSARDYDHYDHGPRYRDRDDRDYRDYRDDRRSRRNSRIVSVYDTVSHYLTNGRYTKSTPQQTAKCFSFSDGLSVQSDIINGPGRKCPLCCRTDR